MPLDKPITLDAPIEEHAQYIFEQTYLRPFPGSASENKINFYQLPVERISHGAQHAARVAILVRILANYLTQTQHKDADLLDGKAIKLLEIVALYHDAARRNDREADIWEKESAKLCAEYLSALGEKTELAQLIYQKEEGGLLGQVLQSADCLDIMRCKRKFDISRMSLWAFFNKQQKKQFLAIIQEHLSLIAEQHDLKHDLDFRIMGEKFSQKATRDVLHPELKQAYEQAENAYLKALDGLQDKKNLLTVYQNQKDSASPAPEEKAVDGKSEVETPGKTIFQKAPFLMAAEIYPEKKAFSRGFHLYCYPSKEEAQSQLALLKELIGAEHPELMEKAGIVENQSYKETPYRFLLSPEQEKSLNKIRTHSRLVKSIRWDFLCFIEDFILGITPLKNKPRHRQNLRPGPHKKYVAGPDGVGLYADRPSPYPEEQLHKKEKRSQHQSTSLVTRKAQVPVFGHNKNRWNKLAGFIGDADDALLRLLSIYDGGTVNRPYEANTFAEAQAYYERVINPADPILFSDRKTFEKALKIQTEKHNEVLARIRWNVTSSSIGIFNDSFEARCVARYYAERTYAAVKTQYEAAGKPWDENYQIPIIYYLPGNDKNWTSYSEKSRRADTEKAQSIYSDSGKRREAIAQGNGEFLLLLNNPQAVWQSLLDDASHPLLTMMIQGHFQLVEALYQRAGHKVPLENALKPYTENLRQQQEILAEFLSKNEQENTVLYQAAVSNRLGILKFILDLDKDKILLNETDKDSKTPLYIAAQQGHLDVVLALLEKGAEVNQARKGGATPLFIAAQKGRIDVVLALLEKGAEVNQARESGATPLFIAAQKGHLDVVLALLEKGAEVNQALKDGATPLFIAAFNGHLDVVLALLEKGAEVNQALKDGATPLYIAAQNGHLDVVLALLGKGAEVNQACEDGATPLFIAAFNGHLDVVLALLEHGADVNQALKNGVTPLYIAAAQGNIDIALALLEKGADVNRANKDGKTPLDVADSKVKESIAYYFKQTMKHPEHKGNNRYALIQSALKDYGRPIKNELLSSVSRFFHGQWNHYYGREVSKLLLSDDYKNKVFDESLLKDFLEDLKKQDGLNIIEQKGDLAAILNLAKQLTGIDYYALDVDASRHITSPSRST